MANETKNISEFLQSCLINCEVHGSETLYLCSCCGTSHCLECSDGVNCSFISLIRSEICQRLRNQILRFVSYEVSGWVSIGLEDIRKEYGDYLKEYLVHVKGQKNFSGVGFTRYKHSFEWFHDIIKVTEKTKIYPTKIYNDRFADVSIDYSSFFPVQYVESDSLSINRHCDYYTLDDALRVIFENSYSALVGSKGTLSLTKDSRRYVALSDMTISFPVLAHGTYITNVFSTSDSETENMIKQEPSSEESVCDLIVEDAYNYFYKSPGGKSYFLYGTIPVVLEYVESTFDYHPNQLSSISEAESKRLLFLKLVKAEASYDSIYFSLINYIDSESDFVRLSKLSEHNIDSFFQLREDDKPSVIKSMEACKNRWSSLNKEKMIQILKKAVISARFLILITKSYLPIRKSSVSRHSEFKTGPKSFIRDKFISKEYLGNFVELKTILKRAYDNTLFVFEDFYYDESKNLNGNFEFIFELEGTWSVYSPIEYIDLPDQLKKPFRTKPIKPIVFTKPKLRHNVSKSIDRIPMNETLASVESFQTKKVSFESLQREDEFDMMINNFIKTSKIFVPKNVNNCNLYSFGMDFDVPEYNESLFENSDEWQSNLKAIYNCVVDFAYVDEVVFSIPVSEKNKFQLIYDFLDDRVGSENGNYYLNKDQEAFASCQRVRVFDNGLKEITDYKRLLNFPKEPKKETESKLSWDEFLWVVFKRIYPTLNYSERLTFMQLETMDQVDKFLERYSEDVSSLYVKKVAQECLEGTSKKMDAMLEVLQSSIEFIQDVKYEFYYTLDTNIVIRRPLFNTRECFVFSNTVFNEVLNKFSERKYYYFKFLEFVCSQKNIIFPKELDSSLRGDDNIFEELFSYDFDVHLFTYDKKFASRYPKSRSGEDMNQILTRQKSDVTLTIKASMFFLGLTDFSVEKPRASSNTLDFVTEMKQEKENIISINKNHLTPIVIEDFSEVKKKRFQPIKESVDFLLPGPYNKETLNLIETGMKYSKTFSDEIDLSQSFLDGYETQEKLRDEIFPTQLSDLVGGYFERQKEIVNDLKLFEARLGRFKSKKNQVYKMPSFISFEKKKKDNLIYKSFKNSEVISEWLKVQQDSQDIPLEDKPFCKSHFSVSQDETRINSAVRSVKLLSKCFESLLYHCSTSINNTECIMASNGLPIAYILHPGSTKRTMNQTRTFNLIFENGNSGIYSPKYFFNKFSVTREYTMSLEDIKFRAELFDNLYPILISNLMTQNEFVVLYYSIFFADRAFKTMLGFLKFYTVISKSVVSCLPSLIKKYLHKPCKTRIHRWFQEKMFEMIKRNLSIPRKNMEFYNLFGRKVDLYGFINMNSIYVYNKKTGSNRYHDFKQFINDIISNHESYEEKFIGMVEKISEPISGKFLYLPAIARSIKLFKKTFDQGFKTVEKLEEDFYDNLYSDFGVFKSSNGGLDLFSNPVLKKKKCIETYLSAMMEIEKNDPDSEVDEIDFLQFMMMFPDEYKDHLGLAKKPQADGPAREIFVTNVARRSQLYIIQSFFKVLCKYSKTDMVVESQFDKYLSIQNSSHSDSDNMLFLNGDMGKWSPQDMKEKFLVVIDYLYQLEMVSEETHGILKKCMNDVLTSKIIIPLDIASTEWFKSVFEDKRQFFEYKKTDKGEFFTLNFVHGWPQGMLHNISSFVHDLCMFIIDDEVKDLGVIKSKNFVSSDDKNSVSIWDHKPSEEEVLKYIEIHDKVSMMFSLEASKTKNSVSDVLTEMVSVINHKGVIYYSPMKMLTNMVSSFQFEDVLKGHKSILSRCCTFFGHSNELLKSEKLYSYYVRRLFGFFGLTLDEDVPICAFGIKTISILEYHEGGERLDNCHKLIFGNSNLVYNSIKNSKRLTTIPYSTSARIERFLELNNKYIRNYDESINKESLVFKPAFSIGHELKNIKGSKKTMFMSKDDVIFNSYYYGRNAKTYKFDGELFTAKHASNRVLKDRNESVFKLDIDVYGSGNILKLANKYFNKLASFKIQYKPSGQLHFEKTRSIENITSSYEEVKLLAKLGKEFYRIPHFRHKSKKVLQDLQSFMKSCGIKYVEQFDSENTREQYIDFLERFKSNLYYRMLYNNDFETLDCKFEVTDIPIFDVNAAIRPLDQKFVNIEKSSYLYNDLHQVFNELISDCLIFNIDRSDALSNFLKKFKECLSIHYDMVIHNKIMNMTDIFQMVAKYFYPDLGVKFTSKGSLSLEWIDIPMSKYNAVLIKSGFRTVKTYFVNEERKQLVCDKEPSGKFKAVLERSNVFNCEPNLEKYNDLLNQHSDFLRDSDDFVIENIQIYEGYEKLCLQFQTKFLDLNKIKYIKKVVPMKILNKNEISVNFNVNMNDYVTTIREYGAKLEIKGNSLKPDLKTLNLDMENLEVTKRDLESYQMALESHFNLPSSYCIRHDSSMNCGFPHEVRKTPFDGILICKRSLNWKIIQNGETKKELKEIKIVSEDEKKSKNTISHHYNDMVDFLSSFSCSVEEPMNGSDLFATIYKGEKTLNTSMIISQVLRTKNLLNVDKNNTFRFFQEEDMLSFQTKFGDIERTVEHSPIAEKPCSIRVRKFSELHESLIKRFKILKPWFIELPEVELVDDNERKKLGDIMSHCRTYIKAKKEHDDFHRDQAKKKDSSKVIESSTMSISRGGDFMSAFGFGFGKKEPEVVIPDFDYPETHLNHCEFLKENKECSCFMNDFFELMGEYGGDASDVNRYIVDKISKDYDDFNEACEDHESFGIFYNSVFIGIKYPRDDYRDADSFYKKLYLSQEGLMKGRIEIELNLRDTIAAFETHNSTFEDEQVMEKNLEKISKLAEFDESEIDHEGLEVLQGIKLYTIEIQEPPKIEQISQRPKFDDDTTIILHQLKTRPIFNAVINTGFERFFKIKTRFEKLKKFSSGSTSTLEGYKMGTSSLLSAEKPTESITVTKSKEMFLNAFCAFVYLYKLINSIQNDEIREKLMSLRNSIKVYLVIMIEKGYVNRKLNDFRAFMLVYDSLNLNLYENSEKETSLEKPTLYDDLVGAKFSHNAVLSFFRSIGKEDVIRFTSSLKN